MQKPFIYRYNSNGTPKGNCFANCLIKGCQFQGDPSFNGQFSEKVVFTQDILAGDDETKEFEPALCYLLNNNYRVLIIDPQPYNGLWGKCIKDRYLTVEVRNYEKSDIERLSNKGWSVVFSTLGSNDMPHAVLSHLGKIVDPETTSWKANNIDDYYSRALREKKGRFLIAFQRQFLSWLLGILIKNITVRVLSWFPALRYRHNDVKSTQ